MVLSYIAFDGIIDYKTLPFKWAWQTEYRSLKRSRRGLPISPDLSVAPLDQSLIFTARSSYASAVLGIINMFVCPTVRPSHACFVTKRKNTLPIF